MHCFILFSPEIQVGDCLIACFLICYSAILDIENLQILMAGVAHFEEGRPSLQRAHWVKLQCSVVERYEHLPFTAEKG